MNGSKGNGMAASSAGEAAQEMAELRRSPPPLPYPVTHVPRPDGGSGSEPRLGGGSSSRGQQPAPSRMRATAYLDGLRGVAAFMVYLSHYMSWFYGPEDAVQYGFGKDGTRIVTALPFIRVLFTGGSAAVSIFFVLSGYVLSKSPLGMLARGSETRPLYWRLVSAAVRRPFRLFIPVIGVSLGFAFVMHLPFGLAPTLTWPVPKDNIFAELANWVVELCLALNPFVPHGITTRWFPYDPPVWTMAVEFRGSLLVFALVAAITLLRPQHRGLALILLGLGLLFLSSWAMACFVAGMVLALNDVSGLGLGDLIPLSPGKLWHLSPSAKPYAYHAALLTGWYLLCQTAGPHGAEHSYNTPGWYWLTMMVPRVYYDEEYWRFWNAIGATLLVFAVLRLRWLQSLLTTPAMRHLGRISFSLYLTHIPFLWVVGNRVGAMLGGVLPGWELHTWFDDRLPVPDVGPHGLSTRLLAVQLVVLPLNLLLARLGTRLLDEPSIRVGQWIVSRYQGQKQ